VLTPVAEEEQLSGKYAKYTFEQATQALWVVSRKWHTDAGPDITVEEALYVTRSVLADQKLRSTHLGPKARELQADIIRHQKPIDDLEELQL
jgi:hypothetical protein